jgi:hypothetical protein
MEESVLADELTTLLQCMCLQLDHEEKRTPRRTVTLMDLWKRAAGQDLKARCQSDSGARKKIKQALVYNILNLESRKSEEKEIFAEELPYQAADLDKLGALFNETTLVSGYRQIVASHKGSKKDQFWVSKAIDTQVLKPKKNEWNFMAALKAIKEPILAFRQSASAQ